MLRIFAAVVLAAGAALYVASLGHAYYRGGLAALFERVVNFIPETWLLVFCLAPGAVLLIVARERGK